MHDYIHTCRQTQLHALSSTCVLGEGVTEAEMFMNTQHLCISIVYETGKLEKRSAT